MKKFLVLVSVAMLILSSVSSAAPNLENKGNVNFYFQDFTSDYSDIVAYGSEFSVTDEVMTIQSGGGIFSRLGKYSKSWSGDWVTKTIVYLNPEEMEYGEGFDLSVAVNGTDGKHRRDFIFHIAMDESEAELLIGASNNSSFQTRDNLELNNHIEITEDGWYTLRHLFYEEDGYLHVKMSVLDNEGNEIFTETRAETSDTILGDSPVVGGNRYLWFTFVDVEEGVKVDTITKTKAKFDQ